MSKNSMRAFWLSYGVIAVLTFGWVSSAPDCEVVGNAMQAKFDCTMGGIMGGAGWPLYWTSVAIAEVRP